MSASGYYYLINDTLYELPESVANMAGIKSRMVTADGYTYVDMNDFTAFEVADIVDFLTREFNLEVLVKFLAYVKDLSDFNFDTYSTRFLDMMNIFHADNAWKSFTKFTENFGDRKIYEHDQEIKEDLDEITGADEQEGEIGENDFAKVIIDAYKKSKPKRYVDISQDYMIDDYTVSKEEEEAVLSIYKNLLDINVDWADIMLYSITASQKFHKIVLKHGMLIDKITADVNAGVPAACYAFNYMVLRMYLEETVDRRRKTPMKVYDEVIFRRFPRGMPDPVVEVEKVLGKVVDNIALRSRPRQRKEGKVSAVPNPNDPNTDSFKRLAPYAVLSPYNFFPSKSFFTPRLFAQSDNELYLTADANSFYFDNADFFGEQSFRDLLESRTDAVILEAINFWLSNGAVLTGSTIPSVLTQTRPNDYDILLPNDNGTKLAALIGEFGNKFNYEIRKIADYKYHIVGDKWKLEVFSNLDSASKVISNFHVPCVRAYFDGLVLKFLPSFLIAMKTGLLVDYRYINANTPTDAIINKYTQKGFSFVINKAEATVLKIFNVMHYYDRAMSYSYSGLTQGYRVYKELMTNQSNIIQAFSLDTLYTLMKQ